MDYKAFHKLSYGLYIIASEYHGHKAGYVANTAFQVTSSPARLAISCHKKNDTTKIILDAGIFSVSVLKKEINVKILSDFGFNSSSEIDKFESVKTITAVSGAPIITDESVAWFDCKVSQTIDLDSHILVIGEILDGQILSEEEPLTYEYYRKKYKMLAPKNAPTYIDPEKLGTTSASAEKTMTESQQAESEEYVCIICGYRYKPEEGDPTMGIPPGTPFEDIPDDYRCPICNAGKEYFRKA